MKFEENWPIGQRSSRSKMWTTDGRRRTASDHNNSSWAFDLGELKKLQAKQI